MKKLFLLALASLMALGNLLPSAGLITATAVVFSASQAQALPIRRVARRTTRRVVRRHMYALPVGAAAYRYGAYNYYRAGGLYYYPYMIGGKTTYVQIDVNTNGQPLPPPPVSQISVEIEIDD